MDETEEILHYRESAYDRRELKRQYWHRGMGILEKTSYKIGLMDVKREGWLLTEHGTRRTGHKNTGHNPTRRQEQRIDLTEQGKNTPEFAGNPLQNMAQVVGMINALHGMEQSMAQRQR